MAGAVATIALATSVVAPVARADDPPDPIGVGPLPIPPLPIPPLFPPPPPPEPAPTCSSATNPFVPKSMDLIDVAEGVPVIAMPRDRDNNPGVPPLDREGKSEMAFDLGSGIRPGDAHGNALFNAHTWPDGSALGNRLLAELHTGDRIIVRGKPGWICYRVTDREEVSADSRGMRYYATTGAPQIAIAVCSGKRVGAGRWTKRTLWYASPIP